MIEVSNFKASDMDWITEQKETAYLRPYVRPGMNKALEDSPYSYTLRIDGKIVGAAGVQEIWTNRAIAWATLASNRRENFLALHNCVKRFLEVCPFNRVEATVDVGFEAGHRWMRLLGFKKEAEAMKGYSPDGRDCALYARVKNVS